MFLIDRELCTGCGQCVSVCPVDAIMLQDTKASIDQSRCRQCGVCADQCPVQAISESVPAYMTRDGQQRILSQQQPGLLSQVLDGAGRLLVEGIRLLGPGGGSGRGKGRRGRHFGRGGFRGRR